MTNASPAVASPALIERYLACPVTHRPLNVEGDTITCPESGFTGSIRDGVAVVSSVVPSFFDSRFEVMQQGHELEGEKSFCYSQQTALLESYFNAGQVLLDVGCGPSLPYAKHPDSFVIGLESSFESIRANVDVDLRVFGSAAALPLPDASIDIVICFYSIHHMVGDTRRQTADNVASAFREFGRVLKPGGFLFVFEMTPIIPFVFFQALAWNTVSAVT